MQQAHDFLEESHTLLRLVQTLDDAALQSPTLFKQWTIADVIEHLHFWNHAALLSLEDPEGFQALFAPLAAHLQSGGALKDYEAQALAGLSGRELISTWAENVEQTARVFAATDPSQRVAWAGPKMSARSSISARQMETWAHGQAVFDCLGVARPESDRLRNIVVLGVNTFEWSFKVRSESPPGAMPELFLTSPSGERWHYGDPQTDSGIEGDAVEFCQVVTQTRNVADTSLVLTGDVSEQWMTKAQCFAGAPSLPPPPGTRFRAG